MPEEHPLCTFLREKMKGLDLGARDLQRKIENNPLAVTKVSAPFLYQLLDNFRDQADKVGMDVLWSIGVVIRVDPMKLFIMSRNRKIDSKFLEASVRDSFFDVR